MMHWQEKNCIDVKKAAKMTADELEGKILLGEMSRKELPEYTELYDKIIEKAGGKK